MGSLYDLSHPPPALSASQLPNADSPTLALVPVTPAEHHISILINAPSWSGPLSKEAYVRREQHLAATQLCSDGGLTAWALVDTTDASSPRNILASCETMRKRALMARKDGHGKVEEVLSHGIGSVFCRDEYRGKGYAGRMMGELAGLLKRWQQEGGKEASFNVLYSDIGKKFYAKHGWKPFPSSHVSLAPTEDLSRDLKLPETKALYDQDLEELCRRDEGMLRQSIVNFSDSQASVRLAFPPEPALMRWHHAREEFVAKEVYQRETGIKGAMTEAANGDKVWCIWTRVFSKDEQENTLYIIRIAIENEEVFRAQSSETNVNGANGIDGPNKDHVQAVAACLRAAQLEAATWTIHGVDAWNPSPTVLAAARLLDPKASLIDRDAQSIASLLWYGEEDTTRDVEWVLNEKYGWN